MNKIANCRKTWGDFRPTVDDTRLLNDDEDDFLHHLCRQIKKNLILILNFILLNVIIND